MLIHIPVIHIHILPFSLFTSPRNTYSLAPEYAISQPSSFFQNFGAIAGSLLGNDPGKTAGEVRKLF
jgi:hypothetical protein